MPAMVIAKLPVAVALTLSVTVTAMVKVPAVVGVPESAPVGEKLMPAGAAPADQPYGDRSAGVKDAFGNQWYMATHIKDATP